MLVNSLPLRNTKKAEKVISIFLRLSSSNLDIDLSLLSAHSFGAQIKLLPVKKKYIFVSFDYWYRWRRVEIFLSLFCC